MAVVIPIESHRHYRFPKVELPKSFTDAQAILGLPDAGKPRCFEFRRRKAGCEVWLRFTGGFRLNLSVENGDMKNREEGRAWAIQFAKQYGFKPMEYRRPKRQATKCASS